jgi:hypothetical protein
MESDHVAELGALVAAESSHLVCVDLADVAIMNRHRDRADQGSTRTIDTDLEDENEPED